MEVFLFLVYPIRNHKCQAANQEADEKILTSYSPFLDGGVQITAWAELHDLTPMLVLVLDKVNGLDNVRVMQRRRDAELGGELLNILFFRLIFAAFAEFLKQGLSDTNTLK
jgi:hypothetical protein